MQQLIGIALAGSVGAVTRFLVANGIYAVLGREFPHGTLVVNVSGCFLMGFLTELMLQRFALAVDYRAAILVGFLGAYTTFSTFSLETIYLFETGSIVKAFLNIFLSVALCLTACWMGLIWGRTLFSNDIYPWLGHGLPYIEQILSFAAAFLLSILAELLLQRFNVTAEMRAAVFIVLLGVLTILSTLWLIFKLSEIRVEFEGLLSIFAINALFGASMVWLGSSIGHWLWQLKLSQ
jgi:CrcB protein